MTHILILRENFLYKQRECAVSYKKWQIGENYVSDFDCGG